MSETLSSGLTLTIPSEGEANWATEISSLCFQKISEHDHTGSGRGSQIGTAALIADSVTQTKIRLDNNGFIRARNFANSLDIAIVGLDTSNQTCLYGGSIYLGSQSPLYDSSYLVLSSEVNLSCDAGQQIKFMDGGTAKFEYVPTALRPSVATTISLGDASRAWTNIYGAGFLQMANTSAPSTPTNSGRLYVVSGALKYIGSSGTVTNLAAA
jgi:hypothetical protein